MQKRKLANTFALLVLCCFCLSMMSFTDVRSAASGDPKKKDSISLAKNSGSLFSSSLLPNLAISIPLNPIVVPFVTNFINKQGANYEKMKVWGKQYFNLYDRILTEYNVPTQLKYLSVIESSLKPTQVSVAGAAGPWQLMASVAQSYGLKTGKVDERKDFTKSTRAAAKMLNNLYKSLGDWLLVIAAYNAGEGRVRKAMQQAHSENFYDIQKYLPLETRNHVKKFIATHFYFEGTGGITTMTADEIKNSKNLTAVLTDDEKEVNIGLSSVEIQGKYNSTLMAKYLQMDVAVLNNMNPGFAEALQKGTSYKLKLPSDKIAVFNQMKGEILKESVQLLMASASFPARP